MKAKEKSCLGRWCLLSGSEQQLKRDLLAQIRHEAQAASPGEEPSWEVLDGPSATVRDVLARCQTGALFGGARVVVIREADRMDEDVQKEVAKAAKPLPAGVAVVLVTGEGRDRRKPDVRAPLRKAIEEHGLVIDCPAMKEAEAVAWVIGQAKKLGKKIEPAAARKLVDQKVGTGLGELETEVEKLALFVGDLEVIAASHVDEVTTRLVEEDIFRLLDAVGRRESGHAVAIVRGLLREKRESAGGVFWRLAQGVRELWQMKLLSERGWRPGQEPDEESAALLPQDPRKNALARFTGRRAFLAARTAQQANAMTWAQLTHAVQALHGCDLAMKGIRGKVADDEAALELLVIQLCTGIDMPMWRSPEGERVLG
jgi:DNA polymerase-3 subunit delta